MSINSCYTYLKLLDELAEPLEILLRQVFHVGEIDRVVPLTPRADVLVDVIRLRLQNAHTPTVKPVLASITTDIEPAKKTSFLPI